MEARQVLSLAIALVVGLAVGGWLFSGSPGDSNGETMAKGGDHSAHSGGERKVAYWKAPMTPGYTSDKPGKSPMGMDLVPVYEDEVGEEGVVKIDPATVQNIGVKTEHVHAKPLSRTIRTVGRVDYDETMITDVNTKISGWVERLLVNSTGQIVKKGQPLLEIYSPELVSAQEEYLTALGSQQGLVESTKRRLQYWDITDRQIAELARTRKVRRTMTLYSPQEGVVTHKAVLEGAHIKSGQHLYRIADLSKVWVYADIYEYEFPWVKENQVAEVELPYSPGKTLTGEVIYIYPYLEEKTRTVQVRMAFPNEALEVRPGMYTNVRIKSTVSREAVTVPVQSVIRSGERNVVIKSLGEGRFRPVDVVLGVEADGVFEVLEGVTSGDVVVTSAQFLIDSESNLQAALGGLGGHSH